MRKFWTSLILCIIFVAVFYKIVTYTEHLAAPINPGSVLIEDDADLISSLDELKLKDIMSQVAEYGNVIFKTAYVKGSTTMSFAEDYYHDTFGNSGGTIFVIDMENRYLYIYTTKGLDKIISRSYANVITDNVYTYATNKDYFKCAYKVFEQELDLFQGNKISQPMKYICNILFALIIALYINYLIIKSFNKTPKITNTDILDGAHIRRMATDERVTFVKSEYYSSGSSSGNSSHRSGSSRSSSSSGRSRSRSSSSRGSGGGHRF